MAGRTTSPNLPETENKEFTAAAPPSYNDALKLKHVKPPPEYEPISDKEDRKLPYPVMSDFNPAYPPPLSGADYDEGHPAPSSQPRPPGTCLYVLTLLFTCTVYLHQSINIHLLVKVNSNVRYYKVQLFRTLQLMFSCCCTYEWKIEIYTCTSAILSFQSVRYNYVCIICMCDVALASK